MLRRFAPLPLPRPSGRQRRQLGRLRYLRRRLFIFFSFRSGYLLLLQQVLQPVLEPLPIRVWRNRQAPSALYPIP